MKTLATVLVCASLAGTVALAHQKPQPSAPQEKPAGPSAAPSEGPKPLIPLRVQLVLSRFKGDKKISSLPYTIGVTANEPGGKTSLRMGIDVPVATKTQGVNYRSVGTNIDCTAESTVADWFRLGIIVENSSIHLDDSKQTEAAPRTPVADNVPVFRNFNSQFTVLLRDGQTAQHTSAVDPISGEVTRIDVTLNVVK